MAQEFDDCGSKGENVALNTAQSCKTFKTVIWSLDDKLGCFATPNIFARTL